MLDKANKNVADMIMAKANELDVNYSLLYTAIKALAVIQANHDVLKHKHATETYLYKTCIKYEIDRAVSLYSKEINSNDPHDYKKASLMLSNAIPVMPEGSEFMKTYLERESFLSSITGLEKVRNLDLIELNKTTREIEKLVKKCNRVYLTDALLDNCQKELEEMLTLSLVVSGNYSEEDIKNIYN